MKRLKSALLKLAIAVLAPLCFLALVEGTLRVVGFGFSSEVFIEEKGTVRSNPTFTFRYFPWSMARPMLPVRFAEKKPEGTLRIFVLGGSAAQGFPRSEFGISGQLEVLLERAFPERRVEVINAAITAINSHVVLTIAHACVKYDPDFLVLYLGNNEVVGPFGPGTVLAEFSRSLAFIRLGSAIRSTRLSQLLSLAMGSHKSPTGGWRGMQMFLQNTIQSTDPRLLRSYEHLRSNLRDILNASESADCPVILSTVGVNLLDNPPFASVHDGDLTEEQRRLWEKHLSEGGEDFAEGKFRDAIASYDAANEIDGGYAENYYRLGQCYLSHDEDRLAREAFAQARDLDVLRFRADSRVNTIIREVAAGGFGENVELVDSARILADHPEAVQGVPGDTLFYDHVHLSFLGNHVVASALAEKIVARSGPMGKDLPAADETAELLAFTEWDRFGLLEMLADALLSKPPFTNQLGYARRQSLRKREIVKLSRALDVEALDEIRRNYEEVLSRKPTDPRLRFRFSLLLKRIGKKSRAWDMLQSLIAVYPFDREAYMELILLAEDRGDVEEARRHFRAALELNPYAIEVRSEGMRLLYGQKKFKEAERYGEVLIADHPLDPDTRFAYGLVLLESGQIDRAIEQFREAVRIDSSHSDARKQIIRIFREERNLDSAIGEANKWIRTEEKNSEGYGMLADLLVEQKQFGAAAEQYEHAILLDADFVVARSKYVKIMFRQGRINRAIRFLRQQLHADPEIVEGYSVLGLALDVAGRRRAAAEVLREGLKREPENVKMLRELAWSMATAKDYNLRNGSEAVRFARMAVKRLPDNADFCHVLAAAYAENGEFEKAVQTAREGLRLAQANKDRSLSEFILQCLAQYENGRPVRSN